MFRHHIGRHGVCFGLRLGRAVTVERMWRNRDRDVAQRMKRDHSPHICPGTLAVMAAAALSFAACSTSDAPEAEASVVTHPCTGAAFCLTDSAVYACHGGEVGQLVDDCGAEGQVCSLARCTSLNCQSAESNTNSLVGCLFYTVEAENVDADQTAATSFLVTNPGEIRPPSRSSFRSRRAPAARRNGSRARSPRWRAGRPDDCSPAARWSFRGASAPSRPPRSGSPAIARSR